MKKILVTLSIAFLISCSHKITALTQADADRGATLFEGTTLATLAQGKALFEGNCSRCHPLKSPTSRKEEQWKKIVPRMVIKVNHKVGHEEIDASEEQLILRYLITMSTAPHK